MLANDGNHRGGDAASPWPALGATTIALGRWAGPTLENVLPALVLVALARSGGAAYALASWVPPQLWALALAGSILRLRPALPVAMGLVAAAAYGAAWSVVLRPGLDDAGALLHTTDLQLVRMAALASIGAVGSVGVACLRPRVSRADEVRDRFGRYEIVREIASGGMGTVLEGVLADGGAPRRVAIKRIHPHLARDPALLARFRAEAAVCARLDHPNLVAALDFGRVDGRWFFAMAYVDGPTLHEVLALRRHTGAPLDERIVAGITRQIAEGLHHAHAVARDERGRRLRVVHRDLSPTNILLDRGGRVRITDFGAARVLRGRHDVATPTLIGKPSYMAPEQLRQEPCDPRADLFSVGVIAYEMLCNTRLFGRDEPHAAMLAVLEAEIPRPTASRPDAHPAWDELLARLLARDPADRLATAADLCAALDALQRDVGVATAEDLAALVDTVEEVPDLELDTTEEVLAAAVAAGADSRRP